MCKIEENGAQNLNCKTWISYNYYYLFLVAPEQKSVECLYCYRIFSMLLLKKKFKKIGKKLSTVLSPIYSFSKKVIANDLHCRFGALFFSIMGVATLTYYITHGWQSKFGGTLQIIYLFYSSLQNLSFTFYLCDGSTKKL